MGPWLLRKECNLHYETQAHELGFHNANCIPCVKATGPKYWALIRQHYPEQFNRMAKLSRELGVRLCQYKGRRIFIDELPANYKGKDPIQPECDWLCQEVSLENFDPQ